jgi:eukaryotic-like serine/threonine-protein kinase
VRWSFTILSGPDANRTFACSDDDLIIVGGGAPAHVVIGDQHVSGMHCLFEVCGSRCFVRDLNSMNGTWLNGRRTAEGDLRHGDQVRVGRTVILVGTEGTPAPAAAPRNAQPCVRCGGALDGPASYDTAPSFLCGTCEASAREMRRRTARVIVPAVCRRCGHDLSALANLDGRAFELGGVAEYLCEPCAARCCPAGRPRAVGDFGLLDRVGSGGFGEVWRARHALTGRVAAVKTILPSATRDRRASEWFLREVAVARELDHPNVVRLYDSGCDGDVLYSAAEYVEGGDIEAAVTRGAAGLMPAAIAVRYVVQALGALDYAHAQGIVHRDIKPSNLLLSRDARGRERVKVSDFGLAKRYATAGVSMLTEAGESRGSPAFMAREQFLNFRFVGPSADVYSAGVVLYYLLTGAFPFDHPSPLQPAGAPALDLVRVIVEDERVPVLERRADLHEALAAVVDIAVQRDPSDRFETAAGFRAELERAASVLPA